MRSLIIAALLLVTTGCYRPFHEPIRVNVDGSSVAFVVQTVNDDGVAITGPAEDNIEMSNFYKNSIVNAKTIEIPYYWKQTGYKWLGIFDDSATGKWEPAARCIVVDTAVTTVRLYQESGRFHAESADSVGFGTNFEVSARIDGVENAIKFLSNYPPRSRMEVTNSTGSVFFVEVAEIEDVLNKECATKIQEVLAFECAGVKMDALRGEKQKIFNTINEKVIAYFAEKGLTITSISNQGGFVYDNKETQVAIDAVFQAQQDEQVAIAETRAAEERQKALQLEGQGQAQKEIEMAKGKAESIRLAAEAEASSIQTIADAKEYELNKLNTNPLVYMALKQLDIENKRITQWNGNYPLFVFGEHQLTGQTLMRGFSQLELSSESK